MRLSLRVDLSTVADLLLCLPCELLLCCDCYNGLNHTLTITQPDLKNGTTPVATCKSGDEKW